MISLVKTLLQLFEYITFLFFSLKGKIKTVQANGEILNWMWSPYSNFKCCQGKSNDADCSSKFFCASVVNNKNEIYFTTQECNRAAVGLTTCKEALFWLRVVGDAFSVHRLHREAFWGMTLLCRSVSVKRSKTIFKREETSGLEHTDQYVMIWLDQWLLIFLVCKMSTVWIYWQVLKKLLGRTDA